MTEDEAWDADINGRNRQFVLNYCTSELFFLNGRQAYIEAYTKIKDGKAVYRPTPEVADAAASRLLRNVKVKQAVKKLLKEAQPEADTANAYRLLHDLVVQATFNPAKIINGKGKLIVKDLADLGDLAKCIEQIEPTQNGIKVKLISRSFAQDKLLKYYDLVRDQAEIKAELPVILINDKTEDIEQWNMEAEGGKSGSPMGGTA